MRFVQFKTSDTESVVVNAAHVWVVEPYDSSNEPWCLLKFVVRQDGSEVHEALYVKGTLAEVVAALNAQ
jgi:hypothetical protein